ncbi:MAG: type II toxin-antitoxin system RelE/ParE family toxin [Deltaproteobacteria bacterium]|nr:type II toxin-antitoxin system RelE/ParE family toxin [Deltaproteobacteria bacterium]
MTGINEVIQSPLFGRQKKKLKKNQVKFLDDAIHKIMDAPELGEQKIGDLMGVRVFKFRMGKDQILLAYEILEKTNFYRDLKKYRSR